MNVRKLQAENPDITTKQGFNLIYDRYSSKIFGFFMHHLQNAVLAEDLLQDVFADIWYKRHQIEIAGPMENYLITTCKYKLVDYFRKHKKNHSLQFKPDHGRETEATPEDSLIFAELRSKMLASFKKMPTRTKEVFLLSRKQGFSNQQIAQNLKVSEKTVEYHIGKTLKQLRACIFMFL